MIEGGRLRFAVDVSRWDPSPAEFDFLCALLPEEDATDCRRFRFSDDQKRALTSRLLQRHAAATALGIPHSEVVIKRTKGRKPYVANDLPKANVPNFNFSVSHEGDYVVLASESLCVCGCDVAAPRQLRRNANQPLSSVLQAYERQLTAAEWAIVRPSGALEQEIESKFMKFWSLKEAYVKATGEGLGFELGRCEFVLLNDGTRAVVAVDGVARRDWIFHMHELGRGHLVAVARAPITAIVDAWGGFKSTLRRSPVAEAEHAVALAEPEPPFTMLHIADLLPAHSQAGYELVGGELL